MKGTPALRQPFWKEDQDKKDDLVGTYIRDFDKKISPAPSMSNTDRRRVGMVLGAGLGLGYGLVSQTINHIVLPGVPFYQPPLGPLGNIALSTAAGGVLGLTGAWPTGSIAGVLWGSLASSLIILGGSVMLGLTAPAGSTDVTVAMIFGPAIVALLLVPVIGVLRWAVDQQEDVHTEALFTRRRIRTPLGLLIGMMVLAGVLSLYPPQARALLAGMNRMVQEGVKVSNTSDLPSALQITSAREFLARGQGAYTLEWDSHIVEDADERRVEKQDIIVRFETGWDLTCSFATVESEPVCKWELQDQ